MCSRLILKIAGEKERQPTSTEPWKDSLYVSLDTGFLATAVKNFRVVLSFNARKAIPHNTGLINNVVTASSPICICNQKGLHAVQFGNSWIKKIPRTAKIGRGRRPSPIWLSEEFFEFNYLQIGQCKTQTADCRLQTADQG